MIELILVVDILYFPEAVHIQLADKRREVSMSEISRQCFALKP